MRGLNKSPNSLTGVDRFSQQIEPLLFSESHRMSCCLNPPGKAVSKPQHISVVYHHPNHPKHSAVCHVTRDERINLLLFVKALSNPEINMDADVDLRDLKDIFQF